ncbi:hypothetical protein COCVIDRAFT_23502 [Bipolaris victoriae FI3]|uniref:Bromo domain-containing protein n=1 Tax=Bipolaris victoriae (strain FI3) TaxID=930091 RepID=W7EUV4_BIPV3|nr:hypothetical protein COCVIDRAFT_23502 [Bipolaris victoriae FI3]
MTTSVSAYTNLESLLLFQCLHAYGVGPSVFARISDLLKKNPDITTHKYFQAGRLSPDALRNFYLERLKRELEHEQAADSDSHNGDVASPTKRKRQSPSLPTVQESLQHQHLIPKLVTKLYASYRYEIAEQIRAEEDRYERLQRELKSIERGEWDDQLRDKANGQTSALRSPALPRKSPNLAQKPLQPSQSPQPAQNGARRGPFIAPSPDSTQPSGLESPRPAPAQNGQQSPSQSKRQPSTPQSHPTPPPPTAHQAQPASHHAAHNSAQYPNITPFPQAQTPQNAQHQPGPQHRDGHPSQPPSPAVGSPGLQYQPSPAQNYGGNGIPQYGAPGTHPQYHPPHQQFPNQQPPGPHSPGLHPGQQRAPYPHSGHQPYPPLQPQMPHPPPQAGFMLPPFQVAPQDPSRVHHQAAVPPHPQASTPTNNRQPPRASLQTPGTGRAGAPPIHPLVTQARQSLTTPSTAHSPQSSLGTPVSAKSLWKRSSFNGTQSTSSSPRPEVEPLDDVPPLVRSNQSPAKTKSQRKSRAKGKGKDPDQDSVPDAETPQNSKLINDHEEESLAEPETRSGRSRRKAPARRTRPGSIASSRAGGSVRDRSRSQSILSHTDTVAADNESQTGNRIKSERGTSVEAIDEEATAETPSHMSTRRRGVAAMSSLSTRRKRNAREASLEAEDTSFGTPGPPRSIIAPRNFARMTAPMMYDINSHKHASTFNTAVRAKDAEGYYDIIKRPTDLSSIKKAIAAGSKQVAAAAAASENPTASPGGATGGLIELPFTADNVPPKAIVNAAQLEKELMRMFVNAVMFNPGEEGVVNDARDMFQTVQGLVSTWRDVERDSGKAGNEGTPAAEEEDPPTASKRRKL